MKTSSRPATNKSAPMSALIVATEVMSNLRTRSETIIHATPAIRNHHQLPVSSFAGALASARTTSSTSIMKLLPLPICSSAGGGTGRMR